MLRSRSSNFFASHVGLASRRRFLLVRHADLARCRAGHPGQQPIYPQSTGVLIAGAKSQTYDGAGSQTYWRPAAQS
jgi:hypothetical protein